MARSDDGTPVEQFQTPMDAAYAAMHEMFTQLVEAGFTETQAIRYLIELGTRFGS